MEATARKPGNVHPGARFEDLDYEDFVQSAKWAAPHLARAGVDGIGRSIREAVCATRERVGTNTNLGIALLIAPLAAVPLDQPLRAGMAGVLRTLTPLDATQVYEAIRLAQPGGLGNVNDGDVSASPPPDLLWAMHHAAHRDWIARQYTTGFRDLLDFAVPMLAAWRPDAGWEARVIHLHLELMARWPDTLIVRKCGEDVAAESAQRARVVLDSGWPDDPPGQRSIEQFDAWLRADGHRRNPGTTADAVAATLFATLRDGQARFPDWVWTG
jgi:triphosphoribosyl-dephospho-CoA synthase